MTHLTDILLCDQCGLEHVVTSDLPRSVALRGSVCDDCRSGVLVHLGTFTPRQVAARERRWLDLLYEQGEDAVKAIFRVELERARSASQRDA